MSLQTEYDTWHETIHYPLRGESEAPWYRLVREYLGDVRGLRVLEVACGRGGLIGELKRQGAEVTGCDFSLSALRAARDLAPQIVQGDAQKLPFADNSFDVVVSCETIEHLLRPRDALREMHRVTKPGGRLLLTTPNYFNFMGLYEVYARFRHPHRNGGQPLDSCRIFPQIRWWVRKAGWTVTRTDGTVHQFPLLPGRNPVEWKALESRRGLRRLLSPLAFHYFILGSK